MSNEVTTVDELRAIVGHPIEAVAKKVTDRLSGAHRLWLAHSPLGFVATTDAQGRVDVSPKGDPPGFVQVLDETQEPHKTLLKRLVIIGLVAYKGLSMLIRHYLKN